MWSWSCLNFTKSFPTKLPQKYIRDLCRTTSASVLFFGSSNSPVLRTGGGHWPWTQKVRSIPLYDLVFGGTENLDLSVKCILYTSRKQPLLMTERHKCPSCVCFFFSEKGLCLAPNHTETPTSGATNSRKGPLEKNASEISFVCVCVRMSMCVSWF